MQHVDVLASSILFTRYLLSGGVTCRARDGRALRFQVTKNHLQP